MKIDISEHISEPALSNEEATQSDELTQIAGFIDSINDSMASFHIGIRMLAERISTLERHVSYLLTQDPKVGATIKEHTAKAEGNEPKT